MYPVTVAQRQQALSAIPLREQWQKMVIDATAGRLVWDRPHLWVDLSVQKFIKNLRTDPPSTGATDEYLFGRIVETNDVKCSHYRPCNCT